MAMALLDAGVPADRFRVDAVDISTRALAQAGRAVYGRNSFRGQELEFRDRHFDATAHGLSAERDRPPAGALSAGQPVRRRLSAGRGDLRRHLLPQRADLLRPRHPGSRHRRAEAAADSRRACCSSPPRRPACPRATTSSRRTSRWPSRFGRRRRAARAEQRSGSRQAAFARVGPWRRRLLRFAAARAAAAAPAAAPRTGLATEPVGRPRRGHAARRSRTLRRSGDLLRGASAPARPVGGGVLSHGPGARRHRESTPRPPPTTARRSISIPITTRRRSTSRC